jgi:hypothetical protein
MYSQCRHITRCVRTSSRGVISGLCPSAITYYYLQVSTFRTYKVKLFVTISVFVSFLRSTHSC